MDPTQLPWPRHKVRRQIYKTNEQLPYNQPSNSLRNNKLNIGALDLVAFFIINNAGGTFAALMSSEDYVFPNAAVSPPPHPQLAIGYSQQLLTPIQASNAPSPRKKKNNKKPFNCMFIVTDVDLNLLLI